MAPTSSATTSSTNFEFEHEHEHEHEHEILSSTKARRQVDGTNFGSTLQSTVRNLAATWTHSGHLNGRSRKTRSGANATPGSVSMALWMGYVCGARGETLFETEYARITLDFRVNIAHETP